MTKLIIIRGLPCSGKTTLANKLKEKLENPNEPETIILQSPYTDKELFENLKLGRNVIIDDLNLRKDWRQWFSMYSTAVNAELIEESLLDVPIDVCIERDSKKKEPWGDTFIKDLAKKYKIGFFAARKVKEKDPNLPDCVIFDIDGTISFCNNRNPYDTDKVDQDTPNEPALLCVRGFRMKWEGTSNEIVFLTGREETCREKTENWISKYVSNSGFPYHAYPLSYTLLMRPKDDKRRDSIVKKELYEKHIKGKYNVLAVFEDRHRVITEAWLPEGLFVFDCGQGEKF